MNRSVVTRSVLSLLLSLFLSEILFAQTRPDRDVSQIQFEGLERISPQNIRRRLAWLPEILEASHSSVDQATYHRRVHEAVARGMLASGFFDSRVELADGSASLTLTIQEGPRFHCGAITVDGASNVVNEWIGSQLLIASASEEDASPAWETGEPANRTPIGKIHRRHAIQQRLTELGLRGAEAVVEFIRNEDAKTQELRIQLSTADASFERPSHADTNDFRARSGDEDSGTQLLDGVKGELQLIHRRWFSTPTSGIRLTQNEEGMIGECLFGQGLAVAIIEYDSHRRKVVLEDGEVLICMDDPPAAIRLPLPGASALMHLQSSQECEDERTMRLTVEGAFTSEEPEDPVQMGIVFSEKAWSDWFPPDSTERSEDKNGVTYKCEDHCLRMDHQGRLIELSGTDTNGRRLRIDSVEGDEIRRIADEIIQASEPIELFVMDRETEHRVSLNDLFQAFLRDDRKDEAFHIPAVGGQRDYNGFLILWPVNQGVIVEPESLIGRLAKLYALDLSQNRRGLSERMMELEPEAMQGPLTSAVMADLWTRQGNLERALNACRHAQGLSGKPAAVQRDLGLLVDSNNLLGRICEQVDIKRWIQQSAQLAAPFADEEDEGLIAFVQSLVALMPDASTTQERRQNAQRLLTFAYEILGKSILEEHLTSQIELLESQHQKVAEMIQGNQQKR